MILHVLLCAALCAYLPATATATAGQPVPLIIDTDMSTDVDDVAALCMAHALADLGEADIVAVVHNTGLFEGVGAVSVINHYYGRDDIPIGAYKGLFGNSLPDKYVQSIVADFASPIKNYSQVPSAVQVYRTVLAKQPDHSVTISSIGFLTNLQALFASAPDEISAADGVALVRQKVKQIVVMGGKYPSSHGQGAEWNFSGGGLNYEHSNVSSCAVSYVLAHMPSEVEVLFSGFEVGVGILTGGTLSTCASSSSPCQKAFSEYGVGVEGHSSFDPATTLLGVRGTLGEYVVGGRGGHNSADPDSGNNLWVAGRASNQSYST